jgi:hypothetical protein
VATTVAVCPSVIVPAVTVNVALFAPLPMETLPGVVSWALSSDSEIVVVPAETLLSVAVQVAL